MSELISDKEGWTADTTAKYENNGSEVSFGYDTSGAKNCVLGYKGKYLDGNTLLKTECEWNSDTFIAFAFKTADASVIPWRAQTDSYYFIIKADSIEVQKRVGGQTTFLIDNVPNKYFGKGEKHTVSIGVIDSAEGPRAILNVDNHNVIDVVDKINYSVSGNTRTMIDKLDGITGEGYVSFTLYSTDKGADGAYFKLK